MFDNDHTIKEMHYQVEVARVETYQKLSRDWNDLFSVATDAPPYLSFPWVDSFICHQHIRGEVCIIIVRMGEKIVALLPLAIRKVWGIKIAEPIGTGEPSYLGLLLDPDHISAVDTLIGYIIENKIFDSYCTSDLSSEDNATSLLLKGFEKNKFHSFYCKRNPCYFIKLETDFNNYLQHNKSSRSRQNLRNQEKKVFSSGQVEIQRYRGNEITEEVHRRCMLLQKESWMNRRGAAVLGQKFYRHLFLTMSQMGYGHAWLMTIDGQDAAFGYALIDKNKLFYEWTAFHMKYTPKLSVGRVLLLNLIRDACTERIDHFDFGHGYGEYKAFFATGSYWVSRVIAGRGIKGYVPVLVYGTIWKAYQNELIRSVYKRIKMLWAYFNPKRASFN